MKTRTIKHMAWCPVCHKGLRGLVYYDPNEPRLMFCSELHLREWSARSTPIADKVKGALSKIISWVRKN